ncbi:MAG: outer membrane protein assembly factor BamA [Candidatus Omnitrophica bacterium]|nr:outer membrane protein assembly factor BamA [Candidatus Omnitrophota bacterium]MDD5671103.1 outer membrane protein assembly factor BamA [Candidatus Omnitrophota bacterium]
MRRLFLLFVLLITALGFMPSLCATEDTTSQVADVATDKADKTGPAGGEARSSPSAPQAAADQTNPPAPRVPLVIEEVEVQGNQIVSTNTILSKIRSTKGGSLVQETINEDLKHLYATGFFQDIRIEVEQRKTGYKLVIIVDEKPIIRQVLIEGNSVFKEDKLRKTLKLIEGQILDQKAVKQGETAIRKLYADKGYRFVDVQSQIEVNRPTKEATVKIRIVEGEKYRIKKIQFEGAAAFKPGKLARLLKTKARNLWLIRTGVFKESDFQKDLERIKLFYQQEGYLDVKVEPRFDYEEKQKRIFITLVIEEGRHYVTGEVLIKGNDVFPETDLWQELEMLPGLTYSQYYLFKDVEKIRKYYFDRGYMEARILPDVRMNRDTGKVDVTYEIQEGDLYFVEKVVIRGNTKTKDIVIRRELRIRPGDRFDGQKIDKSKQRLENLGYFEEITYDTEPVQDATNRKNIIWRVKEKRTGELSFGGGVSSVDKFLGFAEISQRNFDLWNWPRFTGGGQSLSVSARIGSISQDFNVNFVEPYLFNRPYSFGVNLFNVRRDDYNVDFAQKRLGAAFTLSRLFKDLFRVGTGYTLERVHLDDISEDAPTSVTDFAGTNWLSRVRAFTSYDSRDNIFNPTQGMLATLNGDLIGGFLGGDQSYYILETSFTKYWRLFKKHVIEYRIHLGASQSFGDTNDTPVFDRFYAGGLGTVRGYNYRRVGPIEDGDAIGGQTIAVTNLEYTFPILNLDAFRGAAFVDVGQVDFDSYNLDFGKFAVSVGPGIKIKTPIGPVAFYYGFPIANRDTKDKNGRFEFSLGRGF